MWEKVFEDIVTIFHDALSHLTPMLHLCTPESIIKLVFWHFYGVYKWNSGLKWAKAQFSTFRLGKVVST